MLSNKPLISVIMPTFNSAATIRDSLRSLDMQTIPNEQIELLVIDGGSTDDTRAIAAEYGAVIVENPDRVPEKAKSIGLQMAQGCYVMEMDSDESFTHASQLEKRIVLLRENPGLHCVTFNQLISPANNKGAFARTYINLFGDPFTFVVYRKKTTTLKTFRKSIKYRNESGACVLKFEPNDIFPIADGGTSLFDMDYVREVFPNRQKDPTFAASIAQEIIQREHMCGCIEGDNVLHQTKANLPGYINKLRFRVINNIYQTVDNGYTNRSNNNATLRRRKVWFSFYALSFLWPLIDSVRIAVQNRDPRLLAHFVYVYVVCWFIVIYAIKKHLRIKTVNESYG